jgi:outer membrane lipoprotein-sorting protein
MYLARNRNCAVAARALAIALCSAAIGAEAIATTTSQPNPATAPAGTSKAFEQKLHEINARSVRIKDLTADFVQEKQSQLLRNPMVSRGTVTAKGDISRWETTAPEPTRMTCDPHLLRIYYPDRQVVEEYPVASRLGMLAASPLPSLDVIQQNFALSPDAGDGLILPAEPSNFLAARMDPANDDIRKYIDHARVLLDPDRGLVLALEMVDPDGERTVIRFSNIKTDVGLKDDAVRLDLPANVKVVHPLGDRETQPR